MTTVAEVQLWGRRIGAVVLPTGSSVASFEYDAEFHGSGIEPSPVVMPVSRRIYQFPALAIDSFHGMPGLLADALPDKFGNALIDTWLATQGRAAHSMNAVERLCYTGSRGMGALEFLPAVLPKAERADALNVGELVSLASEVMQNRDNLQVSFADKAQAEALMSILRVGTSAGGARAKVVIAWNRETNEVCSGQLPTEQGFEHWLLKFDGVSENRDKETADPQGYGAIEYAYYLMARAAGIDMSECRLLEEGGRRHFMTRRFDRTEKGGKLHMQSLCGIAHLDFNMAGAHSYEQAALVARQLQLPMAAIEQLYRRMAFNIVARNQDDHTKNIAFLMNKKGEWALAPAYDVVYAYNPQGRWTSQHQMTLNGNRGDFTLDDFRAFSNAAIMKRGRAEKILAEVQQVVGQWPHYAAEANVLTEQRDRIQQTLRLQPYR